MLLRPRMQGALLLHDFRVATEVGVMQTIGHCGFGDRVVEVVRQCVHYRIVTVHAAAQIVGPPRIEPGDDEPLVLLFLEE